MNTDFDSRSERELLVHALRQDSNDLGTGGRESADQQHNLELKPAPMFLKRRSVVGWSGIRHPFCNGFELFNVAPPGFQTSSQQDIRVAPCAHDAT